MSVECSAKTEVAVPHYIYNTVHALDWDGTMGVVSRNVELLKEVAAPFIDPEVIEITRERANSNTHDGDFDPQHDIQLATTPKQFNTLGEQFIAGDLGNRNTLYPGAGQLLARCQAAGAAIFGLTHGKNPLWQLGKVTNGIRAAARDGNVSDVFYTEVITGEKAKGPHIEGIRGPQGMYDFEAVDEDGALLYVVHALSVTLNDDRNYSHAGLPADAFGNLVKHPGIAPSREAEMVSEDLRDRVTVQRGLDNIATTPETLLASCGSTGRPTPGPSYGVAFRPAYYGTAKPGTLITPRTSFADLQRSAARQE